MNKYFFILFSALFLGCTQQIPKQQESIANYDTLSVRLEELRERYRPGLGEIMGGIQTHHAKLWYAAINDNWKLADYEVKELKERFSEAVLIETNRPEVETIPAIYPSIDSLSNSINQHDIGSFKKNFQVFTNICNSCHLGTGLEFNVITIPTAPPVTNQDFKARSK